MPASYNKVAEDFYVDPFLYHDLEIKYTTDDPEIQILLSA